MSKVTLVDVYMNTLGMSRKALPEAIEVLYNLLKEREPHINISHKALPSMQQHKSFVISEPYLEWFLIRIDQEDGSQKYVGSIYVTRANEIGLFIFKEFRNKGYGSAALQTIKVRYPKMRLLANIAPKNSESAAFFSRHGFKHIQETYELTR